MSIKYTNTSNSFYTLPSVRTLLVNSCSSELQKSIINEKIEYTCENDQLIFSMALIDIIGTENSTTISVSDWLHDIKVMLSRLSTRVYRIARNIVENTSKQYVLIMNLWEKKIQQHLHDIDDEHFEKTVIKCIPYEVFKDRVAVIKSISAMIEKIESIVNAPIDDPEDPDSYNTPIFVKLYNELTSIGFSMTNKTFTESRSQGYSSKEVEQSISNLDYSKQSLVELANVAKNLSALATKKWLNDTVTRFVKFNESLVYNEKKLMDNNSIDERDKHIELLKVRIRISRLWWLSNFIHMLNTLTEDQMKYALKVFRAAEGAIPLATNPEDDGPGSKYF